MTLRAITVAVLAAVLAACAAPPRARRPAPPPPDTPRAESPEADPSEIVPTPPHGYREDVVYPRSAEEVSGPAVLALMEQARAALQIGQVEQAVATLETALDIEPRNPFVWQRIADAHLRQHLPEQAEYKAQRSNSFSRGNPYVEAENWRLIAESRAARGDTAGAEEARRRADSIQAFVDE